MSDKPFKGFDPDFLIVKLGAKQIPNYPDYYVTHEGQVYSTRNNRYGRAMPIITRSNGSVTLCRGTQNRKQVIVKNIVNQLWGEDKK